MTPRSEVDIDAQRNIFLNIARILLNFFSNTQWVWVMSIASYSTIDTTMVALVVLVDGSLLIQYSIPMAVM